jgi:hypothetical protein
MPRKPRGGGEAVLARLRVVAIDVAQRFEHVPAFRRKARRDLHEFAPGVGEAMAEDDCEGLRQIARQRIAHLNRGPSAAARWASTCARFSPAWRWPVKNRAMRCPSRVEMIPEGEIPVRSGAGPRRRRRRRACAPRRPSPGRSSRCHRCAARRLGRPGESIRPVPADRLSGRCRGRHDLPLRGRRQRDRHGGLQPLEPMKRDAAPVLINKQRDHARGRRVVLLRPDAVASASVRVRELNETASRWRQKKQSTSW